MTVSHKIAEALFRAHPKVVERGTRVELQNGDLVADRGYVGLPRMLDEGIGRITSIIGRNANVEWRDGSNDLVPLDSLERVADVYEPMIHESAYEIPRWTSGDKVVLGNGDRGHILEEVTGPTGFKSYRVHIESSRDPKSVGRRVFATNNAMYKVSGLLPDVVVSISKPMETQTAALVGCELAVDIDDQMIGLQKYSSLPSENGMLFPYDPPRDVTFHMGNVRFPIDVIFIDAGGKIADIRDNRQPGYDESWHGSKIAAVLEVNGGWCDEHGVDIGDSVSIGMIHTGQVDPFTPEINNKYKPAVNDPSKTPRMPTDKNPMDPERFKGHDTPDAVLDTKTDYLDAKHFDTQIGYDPGKFREEDGEAFRPAASLDDDTCMHCGKQLVQPYNPKGKPTRACSKECYDGYWEANRQKNLAWAEKERKRKEKIYPVKPGGCKNCGGDVKPAYIDTDLCKVCLLQHKFKELDAQGRTGDGSAYLAMLWAKDQFV